MEIEDIAALDAITQDALDLHGQLEAEGISHDEICAILGAALGYSLTQLPPASRRPHISAHLDALGQILNAAGAAQQPVEHVRAPGSDGTKIDCLWAWIATDPEGSEGVCGGNAQPGSRLIVPFVGADRARVESYRGSVMMVSALGGYSVKLVRFGRPEIMERFGKATQ